MRRPRRASSRTPRTCGARSEPAGHELDLLPLVDRRQRGYTTERAASRRPNRSRWAGAAYAATAEESVPPESEAHHRRAASAPPPDPSPRRIAPAARRPRTARSPGSPGGPNIGVAWPMRLAVEPSSRGEPVRPAIAVGVSSSYSPSDRLDHVEIRRQGSFAARHHLLQLGRDEHALRVSAVVGASEAQGTLGGMDDFPISEDRGERSPQSCGRAIPPATPRFEIDARAVGAECPSLARAPWRGTRVVEDADERGRRRSSRRRSRRRRPGARHAEGGAANPLGGAGTPRCGAASSILVTVPGSDDAAEPTTSAREPTIGARGGPSSVERRSQLAAPFEVQGGP